MTAWSANKPEMHKNEIRPLVEEGGFFYGMLFDAKQVFLYRHPDALTEIRKASGFLYKLNE
ncbi:hypothetical protein HNQ44_001384 [Planomicrobium koreense]|uniref:Uncharacterized protein n=1 Tax=Planococcus koreensis TaxID=112331 RepID=A0A7W8CU11_9BACL|nr:hypothetical protein [Planococcus koreensis]